MTVPSARPRRGFALAACALIFTAPTLAAASPPAADTVYAHGTVYTVDAGDRRAQALAVRAGRLLYVGTDADAAAYIGPRTRVVDLKGRFVLPGLVDGHLHPVSGGANLLKCNLEYRSLSVPEFQAAIRDCLAKEPNAGPDTWLEVVNWFRYGLTPADAVVSRATLDALDTPRPILVGDSFGHSSLANSRALARVGPSTPDPVAGRILHDAEGQPTGFLEDAAQDLVGTLLPVPTRTQNAASARAALAALKRQGVTSFLDAGASRASLTAFADVARAGGLTARAHFAPVIQPADVPEPAAAEAALATVAALRARYDQGAPRPRPSLTVRNAKLFLDGVISAPANTGALLAPYLENHGSPGAPRFEPAASPPPAVYFPAPVLDALLAGLARRGIDPHLHTDGDGAVRAGLAGVEAMRRAVPGSAVRPGFAHCELVDPADLARFAALGVTPVLSFQWGKPAGDTIEGAVDTLGPERHARIEPSGLLIQAGARPAFGSDWPVDALDEWYALQVAVTREASRDPAPAHRGRLGVDPGLDRAQALRAFTAAAAYELHVDEVVGSLEAGKFADFIVVDQNLLEVPAGRLRETRVLRTVVGGRTVYEGGAL